MTLWLDVHKCIDSGGLVIAVGILYCLLFLKMPKVVKLKQKLDTFTVSAEPQRDFSAVNT